MITPNDSWIISGPLRILCSAVVAYCASSDRPDSECKVWAGGDSEPFIVDMHVNELDYIFGLPVVNEDNDE